MDPWISSGYTRIKNNTNDLIGVYFNDIFLDTLKPQQSTIYQFIQGAPSPSMCIKKENNKIIPVYIQVYIKEVKQTVNTPIYFKGIVNDSIKYKYDLQPLRFNKPTPDSIIIFEDIEKWATIKGSVIDSVTGEGIIGSIVSIKKLWPDVPGVVSDSMGNYIVQLYDPDTYTVMAFHPNYKTTSVQISAIISDTTIVNFSLKSSGFVDRQCGILTGKVIEAESNESLMRAHVAIEDTELGVVTDSWGRYVIYNIPVGSYTVGASLIGYDYVTDTNIVIKPNQTTIRNFILKPVIYNVIH
jgi:hypothetical protein